MTLSPFARIAFLVVAATVAGCPGGSSGPDATPCDLDVEWGRFDETAVFAPFADDDEAEIVLGFQGFRYVSSVLELIDSTAVEATARFQIEVDGQAAYAQPAGTLPTRVSPRGVYVDDVLVFFNDIPMPELIGRSSTVTARVTADGCAGTYAVRVTLVDDENCTEQPDGGLLCE